MIQIAFCDDDQTVLDQLSALLEKYRTQRCIQIQCTAFRSPLDLLAEIEKGVRYDILFLDVIMPAENGITVAKEIRQYDTAVEIIFLTSSTEFAVESYMVGAYFYQLKPIWEESFFRLTDSVIAECRRAVTLTNLVQIPIPHGKSSDIRRQYLEYAFRRKQVML